MTNPAALRADALHLTSAWQTYQRLREADYVGFMEERQSDAIDEVLAKLTALSSHSHQRWNDAYLVAFARVSGLTFVTFDRACHQLAKPDSILLP
jgi:predicted nucleic acid-binding protein